MSFRNMDISEKCTQVRSEFSPYLDGTASGVTMKSIADHLHTCAPCTEEFAAWREIQGSLAAMGRAKAPAGLQARLRAAIAVERECGSHLAWHEQLARVWRSTLAPVALRAVAGTMAALIIVGGACGLMLGNPNAVEANDEPLGAMTAPHYLYSDLPSQAIDFGRHDTPILVEAKVDDQGRVYDYTLISGPLDKGLEVKVQANLLSSVFQPATVFGIAVPGRVIMTYSGVSVRG